MQPDQRLTPAQLQDLEDIRCGRHTLTWSRELLDHGLVYIVPLDEYPLQDGPRGPYFTDAGFRALEHHRSQA
jgi:hypothetical protein